MQYLDPASNLKVSVWTRRRTQVSTMTAEAMNFRIFVDIEHEPFGIIDDELKRLGKEVSSSSDMQTELNRVGRHEAISEFNEISKMCA